MKKSLEANTVDIADDDDVGDIEQKVAPLVEQARVAVQDASIVHMHGTGLTYYNYPTEIKAFGDGEQPYKDLAAAVKKQGEKLEAAEKKKADTKAAKKTD